MISSLGAALSGLQNASSRVEKAAQNIANSQTTDESGATTYNDPTQDIVDLSIAAREFEANAKVLKVEDKIAQSLLDILA